MPYDKEELEKFHQSGRILRETREEMRSYVKENMLIIEVCEKAEGLIRAKGGKPAFPVNVSIDDVTAHYTAPPGDTSIIPAGCTAKIDIGVQIDGYVTDTAFTAAFNPEGRALTATAEFALKTAIENIHGNIQLGDIGALVEKTIKNRGFKPISNLTGHSVGRYLIHAGTS
ncbi:MAG TPA: M24 family metallopeptidase, partial [Oculatellaceae cyanobacterium]